MILPRWLYFDSIFAIDFFSKNTTTPPPLPIRLANIIHDKHVGIEHSHNDPPPPFPRLSKDEKQPIFLNHENFITTTKVVSIPHNLLRFRGHDGFGPKLSREIIAHSLEALPLVDPPSRTWVVCWCTA